MAFPARCSRLRHLSLVRSPARARVGHAFLATGALLLGCGAAAAQGQGAGDAARGAPSGGARAAGGAQIQGNSSSLFAASPEARAGWTEVFATPTLTLGRYRLAKGASDPQQPHARDEVYFVLAGAAQFTAAGATRPVQAGDSLFVAAQVEHRFHDITADLDLVVFFSAARRTTGGMAGHPRPTEQTPYGESSQRGNARIFYWYGPDSAGQVAIDYGQPQWQPGFALFVEQPTGKRWRFGENFWTTLDTNMPLELGGVEVGVGQYYAVLQSSTERGVELVLLDSQAVRQRRLDAYEADKTTGGIAIPLRQTKLESVEGHLALALQTDPERRDHGALRIRFGPYELTADLAMHPHR